MNSCLNHFSSTHPHTLFRACIAMSCLLTLQHVIVVLILVQQPFTVVINRCMSDQVSWEIQPAVRSVDTLQMHYGWWRMRQKKAILTQASGFYPPRPISSSLSHLHFSSFLHFLLFAWFLSLLIFVHSAFFEVSFHVVSTKVSRDGHNRELGRLWCKLASWNIFEDSGSCYFWSAFEDLIAL